MLVGIGFVLGFQSRSARSGAVWLGDQDSNLDKVRQRHLTYR